MSSDNPSSSFWYTRTFIGAAVEAYGIAWLLYCPAHGVLTVQQEPWTGGFAIRKK